MLVCGFSTDDVPSFQRRFLVYIASSRNDCSAHDRVPDHGGIQTMNKKELIAKLAKTTGLSQAKAAEVLNALFDADGTGGIFAAELDAGHKVTIPGFGTFGTKTRAPRVGTNPATRQKIDIQKKTYAFFKPGKTLRERVSAKASS
jgi:DNA-binding protein HU-beta